MILTAITASLAMTNALAKPLVESPTDVNTTTSLPLFVTFDAGIPAANISSNVTPFVGQEQFVWGADPDPDKLSSWRLASPDIQLSYYMPFSRAPAASKGFDLDFFLQNHPDWVLYQCDRETVAFWDGQTAPTGSVPIDFTNRDVIEWQVKNQSVYAAKMGYDAMAFDNFGDGARQGANPGKACGVKLRNGTWAPRFGQTGFVPSFDRWCRHQFGFALHWVSLWCVCM